jgi:predicted enzyme related to lactoylglutathione lyase
MSDDGNTDGRVQGSNEDRSDGGARMRHPEHGAVCYLQLPATDLKASIAFYAAVFGWQGEAEYGSFSGPGIIGQWSLDLRPAGGSGPVLWLAVDALWPAQQRVVAHGGRVVDRPLLDDGARWLLEVDDPAGNRIGLVAPVHTARPQTLIAVRDVEASSRWYQHLLGLRSDHGGPEYERLLADGELVLQLHQREVLHHHGSVIGEPAAAVGNGVLLWFGEVTDFDAAVARAAELGGDVVRAVHRNPPVGNGPSHREFWVRDPDGYTVVIASPDGEDWNPPAP